MNDCVFCKIAAGKLPAEFRYKSDNVLAFDDIKPSSLVHVLIIPKKHISRLSDAKEEDKNLLGEIQLAAVAVAEKRGIKDAFRLSTNNGAKAGQIVNHLHYHLQGGWDR